MMSHQSESSNQFRTYGAKPFKVVLVHGGPGVAGEMASLAAELAVDRGVLEPLQTASSVAGQVAELVDVIEKQGTPPVVLIGFSWGAWLSLMVAAQYPAHVAKLILIGCGPFEEQFAAHVLEARLSRLLEQESTDFIANLMILSDPESDEKDAALSALGALVAKTDAFDPLEENSDLLQYRGDIFQKVWEEAAEMRRTGELLALAEKICCPVVAIHGDYDPHPAEAVKTPLAVKLKNFQFILLKNCGHKPWIERQAKDAFFRILAQELPS